MNDRYIGASGKHQSAEIEVQIGSAEMEIQK